MAITPITAPQSPSKKSERSYEKSGTELSRSVKKIGTNRIPNQLLQQAMTSNSEYEARKEHSKRDDDSSSKRISQSTVDKASLESNESREDYQWRG